MPQYLASAPDRSEQSASCPSPLYPQVLLCWRGCPHSLPGHCVEIKKGFFFLNEELNPDSAIFQPVVLSPDKMRRPDSFLSQLPISKCFIFLDNTQKLDSKLICLNSHKFHNCYYSHQNRQLKHRLSLNHLLTNYTILMYSNNKSMLPVCKTHVFGYCTTEQLVKLICSMSVH